MGSFFFWLLIFVCVIALVVLFFPFKFRVEFDVDKKGALARFFFFKKRLGEVKKNWKGESDDVDSLEPDSSCEPEFVAAKPKPKSEPLVQKEKPKEEPVENKTTTASAKIETAKENSQSQDEKTPLKKDEPSRVEESEIKQESGENAEDSSKKKLTEEEFWTLLLTPDLDARAFRYVKTLLGVFVNIFRVRFVDCFVEGIRSGYAEMGYGAALNGIMKSYPFLKDWELRMDWCHNQDLRISGEVQAKVNICRILAFLVVLLFYAAILFILFWRRRATVLKTHELPKLGYVRRKIVSWISEE